METYPINKTVKNRMVLSLTDICIDHIIHRSIKLSYSDFQRLPEMLLNKLLNEFLRKNLLTDSIISKSLTKKRTRIQLTGMNWLKRSVFREIPRMCPNLRDLRVEGCKQVTNIFLRNVLENCRFLNVLHVTGCQRISDNGFLMKPFDRMYGLMNLKNIGLSFCSQITNKTLKILIKQCPFLEIVNIARNSHITNETVGELIESCRHLKSLNIANCSKLTLNGIFHFLSPPSLPYFNQTDSSNISSSWISSYHLEHLNCAGTSLPSSMLLTIQPIFLSLQSLDLRWSLGVTDTILQSLAQHSIDLNYFFPFRSLCLRGCSELTNRALSFIKRCHQLEELDISWCIKLNPEEILKALENNTLLKSLNISYCSQSSFDPKIPPHYYLFKNKKETHSLMPFENLKDSQPKFIETNFLSKPITKSYWNNAFLFKHKTHILCPPDHPPSFDITTHTNLLKKNNFNTTWWKFYLPITQNLNEEVFCESNQINQWTETQELNPMMFSLSDNISKPVILQSFLLNTLETLQKFKYAGDNGSLLSLDTVKSLSKCEHLKSLSLCLPSHDIFEDSSLTTLGNYPNKKIPFSYFVSEILRVISIKSLRKLQLDFSLWTVSQQNYFMAQSLSCFQHLYKLSLKFTSKKMFLNGFNIEVNNSFNHIFQSFLTNSVSTHFSNLQTLQLFNCTHISKSIHQAAQHTIISAHQSISLLNKSLQNLHSFFLSYCVDITDDDVLVLAKSFPHIKKVYFLNCCLLTEKAYVHIMSNCKTIETLHIVGKEFQKRLIN